MAALNESSVVKRFHGVSATQDSIQSLSLWVLHHKAHHERIVELWFKVFKKAKVPHRLTLLYLCNDIVQTCKRKHAIIFKDAFKEILKDACLLVRDNSIKKNVLRIFTIWEERKIYDTDFISELRSSLDQAQPAATLNSKLLAEFQPSTVISKVRTYSKYVNDGETKRTQLNLARMDALNLEAVKQLKDRAHGKEFSQQFEDACVNLEDYVRHVEKEMKEGQVVIELLEQGELFYDAQYGEAKIVANAYKNFGTRVSNLKRKLEEHMKSLPSPVPSPTPEAPSPGNTPPMLRETIDNNEAVDMELSEDEDAVPANESRRRESTITTGSYMKPIASVTTILMKQNKPFNTVGNDSPKSIDSLPSPKGSPIGMSPTRNSNVSLPAYASFLNNAGASFLANAKDFSLTDSPKPIPTLGSVQKGGLEEFLAGGDSTPVRDENMEEEEGRAGTPVMDETLEEAQDMSSSDSIPLPPQAPLIPQASASIAAAAVSMAPPHMMPSVVQQPPPPPPPALPVVSNDEAADNPMEFLTQLIIHHQAQKKGGKESQNDFLKSLSDMAQPKATEKSKAESAWQNWSDQNEQKNTPTTPSTPSLHQMPQTPPTSSVGLHMPAPPPPPPLNMPMPPRPPASFPFSQSLPSPSTQSAPRGPPASAPMMPIPPQSVPFPGPPPRMGGFNNGINRWNTPPPPPPPPISSAGTNQNYNSQNPPPYGTQSSSEYEPASQGYDQHQGEYNSSYNNCGFDSSQNYDSQDYNGGNRDDKFGPRGPGMSPFPRSNQTNMSGPSGGYNNEMNSPVRGPVSQPPQPPRPPFPLSLGPMGARGPRPSGHMSSSQAQEEADEFLTKLRHNNVTSPLNPSHPRRTLTEIVTGDTQRPLDESEEDLGAPIATVSGRHPRNIRRLSSNDNGPGSHGPGSHGPGSHGPRPRMPSGGSPEGHFRPRLGPRGPRDSYAPREPYHESFHREHYNYGPKRMPPPPMRGGYYPRF